MKWILLFKLRNNIDLDGDLDLAQRELLALVGHKPLPVTEEYLQQWLRQRWLLPKDVTLYRRGVAGYVCHLQDADSVDFMKLFWRLSFCEQVFIATISPLHEVANLLDRLPSSLVRLQSVADHTIAMFIPFYALAEWSDVVSRRASSLGEVRAVLDQLCDALVRDTPQDLPASLRSILGAKQTTGHLFHGLHVYKAKFFPRMARALLNLCGGSSVLDPFVGSGTALVEAAVMGIASTGVDIDPLSVAITKAKAVLLNDDGAVAYSLAIALSRLESEDRGQGSLFEIAEARASYAVTPPFLRSRVPEPILQEVESDVAAILNALRGLPACSPLQIALSDALSRKFKFRFLGLGYGRFSLSIQPNRIRSMFVDNLRYLSKSLAAWQWLRERTGICPAPITVLQGDARQLPLEAESFDCVVTSPPYMPASSGRESYIKSKAYALTALGLVDPDALDDLEAEQIGSVKRAEPMEGLPEIAREVVEWMQNDATRQVKAGATATYFTDLRESLSEIRRVLKPYAKCAYVVARQHVFYRYRSREIVRVVDNANITASLAKQAGLSILDQIHVELRKQNAVARPRSLDSYHETVVMLQKVD